ncbi:hypothetical protein ERJ75_001543200 [Trypanosoma vivax]|nr:hypothetical protein ERJ75_001543200 [Trypanosoma vivax]
MRREGAAQRTQSSEPRRETKLGQKRGSNVDRWGWAVLQAMRRGAGKRKESQRTRGLKGLGKRGSTESHGGKQQTEDTLDWAPWDRSDKGAQRKESFKGDQARGGQGEWITLEREARVGQHLRIQANRPQAELGKWVRFVDRRGSNRTHKSRPDGRAGVAHSIEGRHGKTGSNYKKQRQSGAECAQVRGRWHMVSKDNRRTDKRGN